MTRLTVIILMLVLCVNSHGQIAIPVCFDTIKQGNIVSEYQYKGQQWFAFSNALSKEQEMIPDRMTTTRFYDRNCVLRAKWVKGGIAGLNKLTPDTIDKKNIVLIAKMTRDSTVKKKVNTMQLPDSIRLLALRKGSYWIEETVHVDRSLYRMRNVSDEPSSSKVTFSGYYYDETGKAVAPGPVSGKTMWWHYYEGIFSKTQFRPGYR